MSSQKLTLNSNNSVNRFNSSHDQNGAKVTNRLLDDDQLQQSKRQTRSSKRHVVSH